MPTQLEMVKKQIAAAEADAGPDNPFVKALKQQLARMENPPATKEPQMERFSGGMRGPPIPPRSLEEVVADLGGALVSKSRDGVIVTVEGPGFWAARINGVWSSPTGWTESDTEDYVLVTDFAEAATLVKEARAALSDR